MRATTPPPSLASDGDDPSKAQSAIKSSLLMMGFPSRIVDRVPTLCACHSTPTRGGYLCSRCNSKVCSLPTTCPVCKLTLILSTHLARSYHHLFPLQNWIEVSWQRSSRSKQRACYGCQAIFPTKRSVAPALHTNNNNHSNNNNNHNSNTNKKSSKDQPSRATANHQQQQQQQQQVVSVSVIADGVSESGRYECGTCHRFFCIDCDVFAHEIVHNCPGCQSREGVLFAEEDG